MKGQIRGGGAFPPFLFSSLHHSAPQEAWLTVLTFTLGQGIKPRYCRAFKAWSDVRKCIYLTRVCCRAGSTFRPGNKTKNILWISADIQDVHSQ